MTKEQVTILFTVSFYNVFYIAAAAASAAYN